MQRQLVKLIAFIYDFLEILQLLHTLENWCKLTIVNTTIIEIDSINIDLLKEFTGVS